MRSAVAGYRSFSVKAGWRETLVRRNKGTAGTEQGGVSGQRNPMRNPPVATCGKWFWVNPGWVLLYTALDLVDDCCTPGFPA